MRISDWSSDVCSSDLPQLADAGWPATGHRRSRDVLCLAGCQRDQWSDDARLRPEFLWRIDGRRCRSRHLPRPAFEIAQIRSEEHTSELQSLMRISYAVFCLKKKNKYKDTSYINKAQDSNTLLSR